MHDLYIIFGVLGWASLFFLNLGISSAYMDRSNPLVHHSNPNEWFTTQMYLLPISFLGPITLPWILTLSRFGKCGFKMRQGEDDTDSIWFHRLRQALRDKQQQDRWRYADQRHTIPVGMLRELLDRDGGRVRRMVADAEGNIISIWE